VKHVAALLAAILAFGVSIYFMQELIGFASPWMGLMLMMCVLGVARIAEPLFTLKVPGSLRPVRPWELQGGLYRSLAVPQFGALLRDTPLRLLNTSVYFSKSRPDPVRVRRQLESAEACHFWAAAVLVPYMIFFGWSGWWGVVAGFIVVEIVGHVYPILHLRWVRGRLEGVQRRLAGSRIA
jgi:hypothetical protein